MAGGSIAEALVVVAPNTLVVGAAVVQMLMALISSNSSTSSHSSSSSPSGHSSPSSPSSLAAGALRKVESSILPDSHRKLLLLTLTKTLLAWTTSGA